MIFYEVQLDGTIKSKENNAYCISEKEAYEKVIKIKENQRDDLLKSAENLNIEIASLKIKIKDM